MALEEGLEPSQHGFKARWLYQFVYPRIMVRREGFEPPYSMRADLQSAAFNQLRYRRIIISEYCIIPTMLNISMVNVKGLEPFFYSLQVNAKCMAASDSASFPIKVHFIGKDSDQSTQSRTIFLVRIVRLELTRYYYQGSLSPLRLPITSYPQFWFERFSFRLFLNGGSSRTRTYDLSVNSRLL